MYFTRRSRFLTFEIHPDKWFWLRAGPCNSYNALLVLRGSHTWIDNRFILKTLFGDTNDGVKNLVVTYYLRTERNRMCLQDIHIMLSMHYQASESRLVTIGNITQLINLQTKQVNPSQPRLTSFENFTTYLVPQFFAMKKYFIIEAKVTRMIVKHMSRKSIW